VVPPGGLCKKSLVESRPPHEWGRPHRTPSAQ